MKKVKFQVGDFVLTSCGCISEITGVGEEYEVKTIVWSEKCDRASYNPRQMVGSQYLTKISEKKMKRLKLELL